MKHENIPVLIGYCIPYAFLAMISDIYLDTAAMYPGVFLIMSAIAFLARKKGCVALAKIGNLISATLSFILASLLKKDYGCYFKPFRVWDMAAILSIVSFMFQYLIWYIRQNREPFQTLIVAVFSTALLFGSGILLMLIIQAYQYGAWG